MILFRLVTTQGARAAYVEQLVMPHQCLFAGKLESAAVYLLSGMTGCISRAGYSTRTKRSTNFTRADGKGVFAILVSFLSSHRALIHAWNYLHWAYKKCHNEPEQLCAVLIPDEGLCERRGYLPLL